MKTTHSRLNLSLVVTLTALVLMLSLAGAKAQPAVPGAAASIYAAVTDPLALSFGADGALYVGRDNSGSGGGNPDAVKIHRIGPGGSPVAEFGNAAIPDPDVVIVDRTGAVSGIPGAVLVGGQTSPGVGQVSRIAPDGTITSLFGPSSLYSNPSSLALDSLERLLFTDSYGGRVYRSDGSTPVLLFNLADAYSIAADAADRIVVSPANNPGRLMLYSASGALSNASFASVRLATPMARGPGGFWTTDLYAITASSNLIRIALDGTTTTMGSGFGAIEGLTFGPDGALYASDFAGDRIWRLQPLPSGLVSWWRGEGNANDESGAHPGTPVGDLAYAPGQVGQAFSLNGQNAAVALGNWFNFQQFTLSLWVKPNSSQAQYADLLDNVHSDYRSWAIQYDNASDATRSYWHWGTSLPSGGGSLSFALTNNTWQHWVVTLGADRIQHLYLDGKLAGSTTNTAAIPYDGTQYFNLGKHQIYGRYFNGLVDELMCFNRPLSPEEVASLYFNQGGSLQLSIQAASGSVLLSWSASAEGFGLVSRTNLAAGSWETVTNVPVLNGTRKEVLLPANTPAQRFFRLKQ